ncbi:hypothetical protein K438DRAFT_1871286 [Mycena galopus ATCC 62051]|nr:hypothetical protein K438DRAFT_1871286 [Mycena galopus ATCC 62051]
MLCCMLQPMRYKSFYRKWTGQTNMKVIICMCKWALTRWDEATTIDLASELPALRTEVEGWVRVRRGTRRSSRVWSPDGGAMERRRRGGGRRRRREC